MAGTVASIAMGIIITTGIVMMILCCRAGTSLMRHNWEKLEDLKNKIRDVRKPEL